MFVVLGKKTKEFLVQWFCKYKGVLSMLFAWTQKKKKTHDFINRKGSFDRESLVVFWAKLPTKTGIGWKNQEVFCRHDQVEVLFFFFGQNKNRLHSAMVVQFPFRLCWGSWLCWPPISLGWVVVGVWTKMSGQLEGISLEIFFDICSSKLEVSQAFIQRLQLFLKMDAADSTFFISNVFLLKIRCCSLGGDLLFILVHAGQNVWTCNLYDELALRGVTYDRHFCMMKQEYWFLLKLYNENFWSDDHSITHKSWIQDASRRVRPDANKW